MKPEPVLPVIVAGAGPAGVRCIEELARIAPEQPLKLFSGEPFRPYDRVKLSQLLARSIGESQVYSAFRGGENLDLFDDCPVMAIDRVGKRILDRKGQWHAYHKLVLALGSAPHVPDIPNTHCRNVFTFRDLKDTQALAARNLGSRHTVIIGGGLLGLETARAMQRNHTQVTVVQMAAHVMNQQLDEGAGALLDAHLRSLGIDLVCHARAAALLAAEDERESRQPRVVGVRLDDGRILGCDTVVFAAGIRPRIDLARQHGLAVGKGIRVNQHLQTSDADIYAIGECIQFGEQLFGLVAPGLEHAAIAAHHICTGNGTYQGSINATSLKVVGECVFSVGDTNLQLNPSLQRHVFHDPQHGLYRALFTVNQRLRGAVAIGEWQEQQRLRASVVESRRLWFWQAWRFRRSGNIWKAQHGDDVRSWPSGMVVCNCRGVTRAQLSSARESGAVTIEAMAAATGASTVCGSCKPLLAGFCSETAVVQPPGKALAALAGLGLVACLGLLLLLLWGPIPYSTSVAQAGIDWLWTHALAKQLSGFTLLGLALLSLLLSLVKRLRWLRLGNFNGWRLFHAALGTLCIVVLVLHTGLQLGLNLNRLLMLDFLLLVLAGAVAAIATGKEARLSRRTGKRLRGVMTWTHTLLFWPLPVLLGFHILTVYYF